MAASFNFWVIKMPSHAMRGEVLNVGLLLEQDGNFVVRAGKRLEKIRSITAAIEPDQIHHELNELALAVSDCRVADVERRIASFSFFKCAFQGSFDPGSSNLSEHYISDLLARYVDPEPAPLKPVKKRLTRLRQEMVQAFRFEKVLAKPSEGLESHRILYRHKLAEGVEADFVLKNGAFHVVETVDANSVEVTLQRSLYEIAMCTLTFEHAKIGFGNNSVRPRLVYQASASLEKALAPSLYAAEHQGAEIINWKSTEARLRFIENLANLADPSDPARNVETLFHASALPRVRIN